MPHDDRPPAAQPLPLTYSSTRLASTRSPLLPNGQDPASPSASAPWLDPQHFWYHAQFSLLILTLLYLFLRRLDPLSLWRQYWSALPVGFKPFGLYLKAKTLLRGPDQAGLATLSAATLRGQTICITGANGGVGFETVWHALVVGEAKRVYAGVRDQDTAKDVKQRLLDRLVLESKSETAIADVTGRLVTLQMDHSSFTTSYFAGKSLLAQLEADGEDHLDNFVGTVAVAWLPTPSDSASQQYQSEDRIEWMTAINAVNTMVLLLTIMHKFRNGRSDTDVAVSPSRIVLHSSIAHHWCTLPLLSIGSYPRWTSWNAVLNDQTQRCLLQRYGFSKLTQLHLLSIFSELLRARYASGDPFVARHGNDDPLSLPPRTFAVNPGEVDTTFVDRMLAGAAPSSAIARTLLSFFDFRIGQWSRKAFLLTPAEGARAGLCALAGQSGEDVTLQRLPQSYTYVAYPVLTSFPASTSVTPSDFARDDAARAECWNLVRAKLYQFFSERYEDEIAPFLVSSSASKYFSSKR